MLNKKNLFSLLLFVLVWTFLEGILGVFFAIKNGSWSTPTELFAESYSKSYQVKDCNWSDQIALHPYFGFRYLKNSVCRTVPVNNFNLPGPEIPWEKDEQFYTVLVLGGSVAETLAAQTDGITKSSLQEVVNSRFKAKDGRRIQIINASMAAGVQPMQLIAYQFFHSIADAVISIEGYNENNKYRNFQSFLQPPHIWNELLEKPNTENSYVSASTLHNRWKNIFRNHLVNHSFILYLFFQIGDSFFQWIKKMGSQGQTIDQAIPHFPDSWDSKKKHHDFLTRYSDTLLSARFLAKQFKQEYFVFFQPTPSTAKVLTLEETKLVGNLNYMNSYTEMKTELIKIPRSKEFIFDLENTFNKTKDSVYVDPIHNNKLGKTLLATRISEILAMKLGWKDLSVRR